VARRSLSAARVTADAVKVITTKTSRCDYYRRRPERIEPVSDTPCALSSAVVHGFLRELECLASSGPPGLRASVDEPRSQLCGIGEAAQRSELGLEEGESCPGVPIREGARPAQRIERPHGRSRWRSSQCQSAQPGASSVSIWYAWRHVLGTSVAYGHIYIRDRYRCGSPVCKRRDVTPHHLQFRSAGGSDEDENWQRCAPGAICSACMAAAFVPRAQPSAFTGSAAGCPCLVIDGRERVAA
jgi:hypothetical protein